MSFRSLKQRRGEEERHRHASQICSALFPAAAASSCAHYPYDQTQNGTITLWLERLFHHREQMTSSERVNISPYHAYSFPNTGCTWIQWKCISLASLNRNGRLGCARCAPLLDYSEYRRMDLEMRRKDQGLHPRREESSNAKTMDCFRSLRFNVPSSFFYTMPRRAF